MGRQIVSVRLTVFTGGAETMHVADCDLDQGADLDQRNALVEANTGLVHYVMRRFYRLNPRSQSWDDWHQCGLMGLMRAADTFDPEKGAFSTYATWWVRQSIGRAMQQEAHLVRLPCHIQGEGRVELSERLTPISLHWRALADGDEFGDSLADYREVADHSGGYSLRDALEEALRFLPARYAQVIRLRFFDGLTLDQAGAKMGVTRERIRQIEGRALAKLRERADGVLLEWLT